MRAYSLLCFGLLAFCLGCKGASEPPWPDRPQGASSVQARNNLAQFGLAGGQGEAEERFGPLDGKRGRKLVYNADVDLMVEDLSDAGQGLDKLLRAHDGVVASSEKVSRTGAPRLAVWHLRVPVAEFDAFMKALPKLGEVPRSKLEVQDVTRSHSELEEQIKNMKAEAEGLRGMLKKPTDKLADTLAVREQLSKVSRELAALEARLRRMQTRAEYSTVTLRMAERSDYGGWAGAPLGDSVERALRGSWETFVTAGRGAVLVVVWVLPWLVTAALAGLAVWMWRRRRRPAAAA